MGAHSDRLSQVLVWQPQSAKEHDVVGATVGSTALTFKVGIHAMDISGAPIVGKWAVRRWLRAIVCFSPHNADTDECQEQLGSSSFFRIRLLPCRTRSD